MKPDKLILFFMIVINQVFAQPTSCDWMNLGKGANEESGNCIAQNAQGNISLNNSTQTGTPEQDILMQSFKNINLSVSLTNKTKLKHIKTASLIFTNVED